MIRFTPRRPRSIWSAANIARAGTHGGRAYEAARTRGFERRDEARTRQYSFERDSVELDPRLAAMLQKNPAAARFFHAQPPGYRRTATWWVMSARQRRLRRMQTLIEVSANGQRVGLLGKPEEP